MISKIILDQIASYSQKVEVAPTKINYIYGSNGTGKTTISNVLADESNFEHSSIEWEQSTSIKTIVYNKKFVDENFGQSKSIKGIFTLGKGSVDAQREIEETKIKIDYIEGHIRGLEKKTRENTEKISERRKYAANRCWSVKNKYKDYFSQAYKGFVGSGESFLDKCVVEKQNNKSELFDEDSIKIKCSAVFNSSLKLEDEIHLFEYEALNEIEQSDILANIIVGKSDIKLGPLINKLNNSDWVHAGLKFMHESGEVCPFCQEKFVSNFKADIESFFDVTYLEQCKKLETFKKEYQFYVDTKIEQLREIARRNSNHVDINILVPQVKLLQEIYKRNITEIDRKIASPSIPVSIESLDTYFNGIKKTVDEFSALIRENNNIYNNKSREEKQLKSEVWRYIIHELEDVLNNYLNETGQLSKSNVVIDSKIEEDRTELNIHKNAIIGWEAQVSNTSHTINEINGILRLFSFTSFSLAQANETGYYKIIREDGSEAHETLSEGEYRFITFLYFYHLIKGSVNSTDITTDKVVVFDDPISSLDSSVLFVVSNLIKNVIQECKDSVGGLKQVFILTHNVYFFKEVTFRGGKRASVWREESFWVIKKNNNRSKIEKHEKNPIKTSYELLWREIQNPENASNITVFNTLRRILEYYFHTIGGMDYEACICQFEGEDQWICKSLLSWINDGSHSIADDLVFSVENEQVEKYLSVFKLVFYKMNHSGHYEMMMGSDS